MARRKQNGETERHFVVGISGASGAPYAKRFIESLLIDPSHHVHLTATPSGLRVMRDELPSPRAKGAGAAAWLQLAAEQMKRLHVHPCNDIGAPPASGTFRAEAMIVIPCSMNTLACVAHGIEQNLLTRAAAVTLKEGRPLILVTRETPCSLVDLRNMVAAAEAGAVILPASPGFYHEPRTIDDLVRFLVQKVMDRLGLDPPGAFRWKGSKTSAGPA